MGARKSKPVARGGAERKTAARDCCVKAVRLTDAQRNALYDRTIPFTTRKPRSHEVVGVHYNFVSEEFFREMIERDDLIEWGHSGGVYYGTRKEKWTSKTEIDAPAATTSAEAVAPPVYTGPPLTWAEKADRIRRQAAWEQQSMAIFIPGFIAYHKTCTFTSACVTALMTARMDAPTEAEFIEAMLAMVKGHERTVCGEVYPACGLYKLLTAGGIVTAV